MEHDVRICAVWADYGSETLQPMLIGAAGDLDQPVVVAGPVGECVEQDDGFGRRVRRFVGGVW